MSAESLRAEIDFALEGTGQSGDVGAAALTDVLRVLHEVLTKSDRDQKLLMAQVQTVFGSTAMHHLGRVIDAETKLTRTHVADDRSLHSKVEVIFRQRGFTDESGRHLFTRFLKALDKERMDSEGNIESATVMMYWTLGDEAAYHLGGLFTGDLLGIVSDEMAYLDSRLRRFYKLVEMWEMEMAWDREEAE